VDFWM